MANKVKKAMWKVYATMSPSNTDSCTVLAETIGEAAEKGADHFRNVYNSGVNNSFDDEDIIKIECLGRED